ncbi:MAG: ribosome small subunit-dependent GTPase A [Bacillota bacterium]|nr:ribosome small subunit-dependent GTPase A [Bacillota bacterium]
MNEGLLIKGYNGFYYVRCQGVVWTCSLRGRFRLTKQKFLPGDRVKFTDIGYPKGVIEEVLPRKNYLLRPAVANVEQGIITFALTNPKPDFLLLDRILIQMEAMDIQPVICFNKADLLSAEERREIIAPYERAGYTTVSVSAETGEGIEDLREIISGSLIVMAGPSGTGKSSILNALNSDFALETGELSKKVERGRHTTRRVELLILDENTFIADTPGFSSLYLPDDLDKYRLGEFFPEIAEKAAECPFRSCLHHREQECAVKSDVEAGNIDKGRYERYLTFLDELQEREEKY